MSSTANAWEVWPSSTTERVLILANGFEDRYYVAERVRQGRAPWGDWYVFGKTKDLEEGLVLGYFPRLSAAVKEVERIEADAWSADVREKIGV